MKSKHLPIILVLFLFISNLSAEDYYWRGQQGNWSDVNNWITSTGLIPGEVPSESDNVFFDYESFSNPFDTLFIDSQNPTCNNFKFIGTPYIIVIVGGNPQEDFNVFGSFTSNQNVINDYHGNWVFQSLNEGNKIETNGSRFTGSVIFDGPGEWTLMDDLYVYADSVSWEEIMTVISDTIPENDDIVSLNGPVIIQKNGTLLSDGHAINARGFQTITNNNRLLNITNSEITIIGAWILTGENLDFLAENSFIIIGGPNGGMANTMGEEIHYHDILLYPTGSSIENTKIRTIHRKVYFMSGGNLEGKFSPNSGSFTIDTLIFNGYSEIIGPDHQIQFTEVNHNVGEFDVKNCFFHRVDFNGFNLSRDNKISGLHNTIDSVFSMEDVGILSGNNEVNYIAYFDTLGIISAAKEFENKINHVVFKHDGFLEGINMVDTLTLSTGFWYQLMADSLRPSGDNSNTFVQHIGYITVEGDCSLGNSILTSNHKETRAVINYYGGVLEANYLMLKDLKNMNPNIPIVVNNGIDAGNNIGFEITNPDPRDYYWVKGGGLWSDSQHWSLESGGEPNGLCVPTILDNVIFDDGSGFTAEDSIVMIDINHATVNNFIWKEGVSIFPVLPLVSGNPENTLRIWGDFTLNISMSWDYSGRIYFASEDDLEWENIFVEYTDATGDISHDLFNKTYFYGRGGKWELTSDLANLDTLFLNMGELLVKEKTLDLYNFNAEDTLTKGLYLVDSTLIQIHQRMEDVWVLRAYKKNEKTFFDAGWSTIRLLGDIPPGTPSAPGNMRTSGTGNEAVVYHNVEFGLKGGSSRGGELRSLTKCRYNLVDYYSHGGNAINSGPLPSSIDTLTFKSGYHYSRINDNYNINFLIAESEFDTIVGAQNIDTAYFYLQGSFMGFNHVDYLEAFMDIQIEGENNISHAVYHGNSIHIGKNNFKRLELAPDKISTFKAVTPDEENVTYVSHDLIAAGHCDKPIRLQSSRAGKQAQIYYDMLEPTYDFTARYTSIKDIEILGEQEYNVEESIDLGNNDNWTWLEATDTIFYWVRGTGRWDDSNHWSRTSGGPPVDGCVPREITHVVFDDSSFFTRHDTVYLDTLNAYCKDMLWLEVDTSAYKRVFYGNSKSNLFIYGSLILSEGMNYQYGGTIYFDNIKDSQPNYVKSAGQVLFNPIRLQGIGDYIILLDDLVNNDNIYLEHGGFEVGSNTLKCAGFYSNFENDRIINIENSEVFLSQFWRDEAWWVYGKNLELKTLNSTINLTGSNGIMMTEYAEPGVILQYHDVVLDAAGTKVDNSENVIEYNTIYANSPSTKVTGNYIADTINLFGPQSSMNDTSFTNVVVIDSTNCAIVGHHEVSRCFVHVGKGLISGDNYIKYCNFNAEGEFRKENVFDTLLLYPGTGENSVGNTYTFESTKTQFVNDSLLIRGNPCANMTLKSSLPNIEAYIKKDYGYDVVGDFLLLQDVGVQSEDIAFYAGAYSSAIPDPNSPPSGWTMENASNYEFGFGNGNVIQFCNNETYLIDAINFNAGPGAQYYWNGSDVAGDQFFAADSAGQYTLKVYYSPICYRSDYINLEGLESPRITLDPGPYCVGDPIIAMVEPNNLDYNYEWFNGESGESITAELDINSIFINVENTINNCKSTAAQTVLVNSAPDPETALGEDIVVNYGESFKLDAGSGDSYKWYSFPPTEINPDNEQYITITNNEEYGYIGDIKYYVLVTLGGCQAEGFLKGELIPPGKLGVPTAFSPNGDGSNDELKVLGTGFVEMDFSIYNRYGKLIYKSTDWNQGWDGTYEGKKQEMDVYTYYIKVRFEDETIAEDKGNITLLR